VVDFVDWRAIGFEIDEARFVESEVEKVAQALAGEFKVNCGDPFGNQWREKTGVRGLSAVDQDAEVSDSSVDIRIFTIEHAEYRLNKVVE